MLRQRRLGSAALRERPPNFGLSGLPHPGEYASTMASRTLRGLLLIGALKLLKGLVLLAAGIGVLSLLHRDAAETVRHWIEYIRVDPHDRLINHFLEKVSGVSHHALREIAAGTLFYAAVFCTEGVGLLLGKRWAEYMAAGVTLSFLPLEAYEFFVHP